MKPEDQRIAIAEACGLKGPWKEKITACWCDGQWDLFNAEGVRIPDYLNDLNAMNQAEKILSEMQRTSYFRVLECIVDRSHGGMIIPFAVGDATAAQRAEAFLKTIGKWKD